MLKPALLFRCLGILLVLPGFEAAHAQEMVFPGKDWTEATPESQGLDAAKLRVAVEFLEANAGGDGARELVIVRHGRLVWKGDNIDKRHGVWSCTKSFTSTVLGLLVADGKCSPDTRGAELVPELKAVYPEVTLRHFTTMTSGYRAVGDETTGSYKHGPSKTPFQPNPQPLFTPPGAQYAYWDSAMNVFGLALTRAAGEPMEELFRRRIADPIGMKDWDWGNHSQDRGVVVNGGSGNGGKHIHITAREMARFGHLYLNEGNWNGRQLVPREWVRQAASSEIDGRGCYGFNWLVNGLKADGKRLWPGAPTGTYAASGHNNNKCFIIPEWGMVVVRLGLDQGDRKISEQAWGAFLERIGGAMVTPPVGRPAGR
jgi:CubicO group peptidase (beta-lactamase class C family)